MMQVRKERTNWRDEQLVYLHNQYGISFPCYDTEFIMVEYDNFMPRVVIDYQQFTGNFITSKTLVNLCESKDGIRLPYIIVQYALYEKKLKFYLYACNSVAESIMDSKQIILEEPEFIKFLFDIRAKYFPIRHNQGIELAKNINNVPLDLSNDWPGEIISHRHRNYGYDCPVADLDCLLSNGIDPKALIEYKNIQAHLSIDKFLNSASCKMFRNLINNTNYKMKLLLVYYDDNHDNFRVYNALNNNKVYKDFTKDNYFKMLKKLIR